MFITYCRNHPGAKRTVNHGESDGYVHHDHHKEHQPQEDQTATPFLLILVNICLCSDYWSLLKLRIFHVCMHNLGSKWSIGMYLLIIHVPYYKCEQCNNKNVFVRGKFCEDQFFVKFVTTTIYLGTTKNYVYLLFPYEISYKRMLYYIIITKILPHRNILVCQ